MSGVTLEELAKQVGGISVAKLSDQLQRAGIIVSGNRDVITDEQKEQLLTLLREERGEDNQRKQISLKRRTVDKLEVKSSSGKATVNVVRKRRRVYVKRDELESDDDVAVEVEEEAVKSDKQQVIEEDNLTGKVDKQQEDKADKISKENLTDKSESAAPVNDDTAVVEVVAEAKDSKDKGKKKSKQRTEKEKTEKTENLKKDQKVKQDKEKRKVKTKAQLLVESSDDEGDDITDEVIVRRKSKSSKAKKEKETQISTHAFELPVDPQIYEVKIPDSLTVSELAHRMSIKAAEVIKVMMQLGTMATINQTIEQEVACLVVEEMGHKPVLLKGNTLEDSLLIKYEVEHTNRAPIVTVMGHVDHGKTSLLDYIRSAKVTHQEAGGITQHIGAYQVDTTRGKLTFLDTPGHSAFSAMRARGANCTDMVVLVVAADDGVMPQTVEAIQHAKAAKVPIIVAVNKIDKPEADIERVTSELSQHELIPESWGGDTMFCKVSAKEGTGIDDLLEVLMLQAEMLELVAPRTGPAQGVVIESRMDKGRGAVATLLVQSGLLSKGDMVLAGIESGRVKVMHDALGAVATEAGPSIPVEIIGLSGAPVAGEQFQVVEDERKAKEVALYRQAKQRELKLARQHASKLEGFMDKMQQGAIKELNIVLKADVQGSVEALTESLEKLSNEEIQVKVVGKGVGGFNESDVNLAMASTGVLLGFNVRADATARKLALSEGIELNYYSVIYDVIDGVKAIIDGKFGPKYQEKIIGLAEVRDVFRSSKIGAIAGCMVIDGMVKRGNPIRVLRDNVVIYEGELESLRRFKENVAEVRKDIECGIGVKNYNDVKVGDQIENFEVIAVPRGSK